MNKEQLQQAYYALRAGVARLSGFHNGGVNTSPGGTRVVNQPGLPGCVKNWDECTCEVARTCQDMQKAADAIEPHVL